MNKKIKKVIAALTHRLKRRMRVHLNAAWNRIRVWGKQATRTKAQALRQRQRLVGGLHPQSQQQRSSIAAGSEESRPNEPRAGKFSQSSSLDKDVGIGSDRPAAWCQLPLFLTQLRSCFRAIAGWAVTPLDPMIEKKRAGGGLVSPQETQISKLLFQGLSCETAWRESHIWQLKFNMTRHFSVSLPLF